MLRCLILGETARWPVLAVFWGHCGHYGFYVALSRRFKCSWNYGQGWRFGDR